MNSPSFVMIHPSTTLPSRLNIVPRTPATDLAVVPFRGAAVDNMRPPSPTVASAAAAAAPAPPSHPAANAPRMLVRIKRIPRLANDPNWETYLKSAPLLRLPAAAPTPSPATSAPSAPSASPPSPAPPEAPVGAASGATHADRTIQEVDNKAHNKVEQDIKRVSEYCRRQQQQQRRLKWRRNHREPLAAPADMLLAQKNIDAYIAATDQFKACAARMRDNITQVMRRFHIMTGQIRGYSENPHQSAWQAFVRTFDPAQLHLDIAWPEFIRDYEPLVPIPPLPTAGPIDAQALVLAAQALVQTGQITPAGAAVLEAERQRLDNANNQLKVASGTINAHSNSLRRWRIPTEEVPPQP